LAGGVAWLIHAGAPVMAEAQSNPPSPPDPPPAAAANTAADSNAVNAGAPANAATAAPNNTGANANNANAKTAPAPTAAEVAARSKTPARANPNAVKPPTRVVASTPAMVTLPSPTTPMRTSGPRSQASTLAPQEEQITYHYNALGRRDPFQPLIGGGFIGADEGGKAAPDVGGIKVVGIVWGTTDKFALIEDPRGNSMVLRQGDKVMNGVVEELKRGSIVVKLSVDGQTQSVEIPLTLKGDKDGQ
jgi:hypothetical protein